jgi:protein-S-isoprenylcysteine O-methyltransferase Ste14
MLLSLLNTFFRSEISTMVAKVYIPVLFPLTFLICLLSVGLDQALNLPLLFAAPTNLIVAGISFVTGVILWLWTYEQLSRLGEGSPSPTAGRTMKLVKTGIYQYSRNPSLFGKLLGFLAVGFALNSMSFCLILTPLLLTGSLIEKVWRQEPQLVEIFGDEYLQYQKEVPLFIPWTYFFPRRKNK